MSKKNVVILVAFVFIFTLGISFSFQSLLAWVAPTATPPDANVPAPLNVSATAQTKAGLFTAQGGIVIQTTTGATPTNDLPLVNGRMWLVQ